MNAVETWMMNRSWTIGLLLIPLGIAAGCDLEQIPLLILIVPVFLVIRLLVHRSGSIPPESEASIEPQSGVMDFNPEDYFDTERGLFLGLDGNLPFYCPAPWPHIQICGSTGSGKSALMGVMASQCLLAGERVAFWDPKQDRWLEAVLRRAAAEADRPFVRLDLRPGAPAQTNLLHDCSAEQLEMLLHCGLDLQTQGRDSDYYRLQDRHMAYLLAHSLERGETLSHLVQRQSSRWQRQAPALTAQLIELARHPSLNAAENDLLRPWLEQSAMLYIIGSLHHDSVQRLQRMVLVRILQLLDSPCATRTGTGTALFLDEFRHQISRFSLEALATARDRGVHAILAHQSMADLRSGPAYLPAEAVLQSVIENCTVKLFFRLQDPDTAQWVAERSGERTELQRSWQETRAGGPMRLQLREQRATYCRADTLMHLPKGKAIVLGCGPSTLIQTRHYHVDTIPELVSTGQSPETDDSPFAHLESS